MEAQALAHMGGLLAGAGEYLSWGIVYIMWNQGRIRKGLEDWKATVERRLVILETLNPEITP